MMKGTMDGVQNVKVRQEGCVGFGSSETERADVRRDTMQNSFSLATDVIDCETDSDTDPESLTSDGMGMGPSVVSPVATAWALAMRQKTNKRSDVAPQKEKGEIEGWSKKDADRRSFSFLSSTTGRCCTCASVFLLTAFLFIFALWAAYPIRTANKYDLKDLAGRSTAIEVAGSVSGRPLRINELQVVGSHNSYHQRSPLGGNLISDWAYENPPLTDQLELGLRYFELDIHYSRREKSFFVYHLPFVDDRSSCDSLRDCLFLLRRWSDENPGHHVVFLALEMKQKADFMPVCGRYGRESAAIEAFQILQEQVLEVFPRERLVLPSSLLSSESSRNPSEAGGGFASISDAAQYGQWPTVEETRGKFLFFQLWTAYNFRCREPFEKANLKADQGLGTIFFEAANHDDVVVTTPFNGRDVILHHGFNDNPCSEAVNGFFVRAPLKDDANVQTGCQLLASNFEDGEMDIALEEEATCQSRCSIAAFLDAGAGVNVTLAEAQTATDACSAALRSDFC